MFALSDIFNINDLRKYEHYVNIEKRGWNINCLMSSSARHFLAKATERLLVGSIDFGTTYSGWAYSFSHDFKSNPTKAFVQHWHSESGTLFTEKTPTCLLIKPDGKTLEAFGYEAENRYRDLADTGDHSEYFYFRRFKMALHSKLGDKLGRDLTLDDEMGKSLPALQVFAMAIKYMVDNMMKAVKDTMASAINKKDVHWVLTVPAIWTDAAKQFMREAAIEAEISTHNLTIALESETASIFCRHLTVDTAISGGNVSIATMPVGTKYLVLDAGGGTIDITIHEIVSANSVREIQAASGGGWGGIVVDRAFENLLIEIVGEEVYTTFKKTETEDWLDLWRDFEVKKRTVGPDKTARINMRFPLSLSRTYKKVTKNKLEDTIPSSGISCDIEFGGDKIKFSANIFKGLFKESIVHIVNHVQELLRDREVMNIRAILLVGGFSDSPMLQQAIKESFSGLDVIIPRDASSTILRGALIYGHSPFSVTERVLKYTYGIETSRSFKEGVDPEHLKKNVATGVRCKTLSKHVKIGQRVKCNEPQVEKGYRTHHNFQRKISFPVYASTSKNIKYRDDATYIGRVSLNLPDPEEKPGRLVFVSMTFSGTEIEVKAKDEKTGNDATAYIDFLG